MSKYLSQRDPRWAGKRIGASTLTIGRFGCTITDLAQLSTRWGRPLTPDKIAENKNWFTSGGLIIWRNLQIAGMKFERRLYGFQLVQIVNDLKAGKGVLLQVNDGAHWILAERKMWFRNDFVSSDPWTGEPCAAIGDYHNITGSAHFANAFSFKAGLSKAQLEGLQKLAMKPVSEWSDTDRANWSYGTNGAPPPTL